MRSFYAKYQVGTSYSGNNQLVPIGESPADYSPYSQTLFYEVQLFSDDADDLEKDHEIGTIYVRRILLGKVVNQRRSVWEALDCVDQLQADVGMAVWDIEEDEYRMKDAMFGDLVIFEEIEILGRIGLHGFDINAVLDDVEGHVCSDIGVTVYLEPFADLVHFNSQACEPIPGIGYARSRTTRGLAR